MSSLTNFRDQALYQWGQKCWSSHCNNQVQVQVQAEKSNTDSTLSSSEFILQFHITGQENDTRSDTSLGDLSPGLHVNSLPESQHKDLYEHRIVQ